MEKFPEMNWSEVARQAFIQKVRDLEFLKKFTSDSAITEEDALKWGKEVSKSLSNRLRKLNQ
ncbi:hypothetical protein HYT57_04870 [Candidatus Woesearchaeota archaeon]|nr:hypothetical protein [Candidatus Woesearchaeota archaeon]